MTHGNNVPLKTLNVVFSCEATLDNTENVTNSLTHHYRNSMLPLHLEA